MAIADALAGTGTLNIDATAGDLTLQAENAYSGDVHLTGGNLLIGDTTHAGTLDTSLELDTGTEARFDHADDRQSAVALSGNGLLRKNGAGQLTLGGDSGSFTGSTEIEAGTLQVGDGTTKGALGGDIDVAAGAALAFDRSDDITYADAVTGSGELTKLGAGTLTLTGAGSHTGGTTVSAGTLQVGDGGTTGSITGDVTNNATLTFNRSDDVTFDDAITGSGTLTKLGAGTLTLTDANTYSGDTTVSDGTLRIGDGTTTGSIAGDVVNNATLAFDRSDSVTFTGDVSGTGGLAQMNGDGTLILNGSNSYSGATAVDGGTLRLQGGAAVGDGSAVTVAAGATLDVEADETIGSLAGAGAVTLGANALTAGGNDGDTSFSGTLAGTGGSLVKAGTGTLTLTGTSSHTGGTTVSAGTLQVGDGGTTGSVTGDVTNNATLTFNRSDDVAFDDAITGTGVLTKLGAGILTLTDDASHTGGTTVSDGALQVGDGGTSGSITGDITNNATLTFNRSNDIIYDDAITGTGAVTKLGAGTLVLDGANLYTGATTVTAGTLRINGSITSDVTVADGATLGGSGEVGAVSVAGGGRLAAGNSPGILSTGNLTLAAGSTFEEEIGGTTPGGFDSIAVTGTVDLGGATFSGILYGGFRPSTGASFTIIDNDGVDAVVGRFANLSEGERLAFGGRYFTISYQGGTGNDVTLTTVSPPPPPPPSVVVPTPGGDLLIGVGSVSGLAGNDTIDGGSGSDIVYGNQGDDVITVSAGQDTTFGGQGDDVVNASLAAEPQEIHGNRGADSLTGSAGDDLIYGNQDNDLVYGNRGSDALFGGQGDDTLFGGQGDDRIIGNRGNDLLVGGLGADLFIVGAEDGADVIADFSFVDGDRIDAGERSWTVSDSAAGALLDFGGGNRLTLSGIAAGQVSASWFAVG